MNATNITTIVGALIAAAAGLIAALITSGNSQALKPLGAGFVGFGIGAFVVDVILGAPASADSSGLFMTIALVAVLDGGTMILLGRAVS